MAWPYSTDPFLAPYMQQAFGGGQHYLCDKVRKAKIPITCDQDISKEASHIGDFEYKWQ